MKIISRVWQLLMRHWLLFVFVILLVLPFVFMLYIVKEKLIETPSDYVQICCTILTYISTIIFSGLAVFQNKKANELSELVYRQAERAYLPSFAIQNITYMPIHNCTGIQNPTMKFCQVEFTPDSCEAFNVTITNCGDYPITNIHLDYIYVVGKKFAKETSSKEQSVVIPPKGNYTFCVCDTPEFQTSGTFYTFEITCSNIFGYSTTILLEFACNKKTESQSVKFRCKAIDKDTLVIAKGKKQ